MDKIKYFIAEHFTHTLVAVFAITIILGFAFGKISDTNLIAGITVLMTGYVSKRKLVDGAP